MTLDTKKPPESTITYQFKDARKNLKLLASELTLNYYRASSIDLYPKDQREEKIKNNGAWVFEDFQKLSAEKGSAQLYSHAKDTLEPHRRNVLIIGAGASYNSFENIPKGNKTIEEIKKKIIVSKIKNKDYPDKSKDEFLEIDLNHLLTFADRYDTVLVQKRKEEEIEVSDFIDSPVLNCAQCNAFLLNQFKGVSYSTLPEMAKKFMTSIKQWNLSHAIDNSGLDNIEFETFFWSLCEIFPMEMVRNLLSETYGFRHAPTLFYSLVAHLFKNRFIDVIINFNFDELLDQAIQDEIGLTGYDRIISDGDCVPLDKLTDGGRLRQPLYIKPHGTFSHKSSLRFTKDQYHNLPFDIRQTLIDLFSCQKESQIKRTNLICVGFDMNSVEFNEVLAEHLPENSKMFFFFNNYNEQVGENLVERKVNEKARYLEKQLLHRSKKKPATFFVPINFFNFPESGGYSKDLGLNLDLFLQNNSFNSLDKTFYTLNHLITNFFVKDFKPRDIVKHKLICAIFGNKDFWEFIANRSEEDVEKPKRWYPTGYFKSEQYLLDRVIVEMGVNLAMNKGSFDPSRFLEGSAGYYYRKYINKREGKEVRTLLQLMQNFQWMSTESLKILGINSLKRYDDDSNINFEKSFDDFMAELVDGNIPISKNLKAFLQENKKKIEGIRILFSKLHKSNNSKIHSEFRATSNHIYEEFSSADILNTDLQLDLHAHIALTQDKANVICAVADNGYQLAKLLPHFIEYQKASSANEGIATASVTKSREYKVFLIAEDQYYPNKTFEEVKTKILEKLKDWDPDFYKSKVNTDLLKSMLEVYVLPIEDHNRHMLFFLNMENFRNSIVYKDFIDLEKNVVIPKRAIYYYKKGLSTKINPIKLEKPNNLKYMLQMFGNYSLKAREYMHKKYKTQKEWIVIPSS